MKRSFCFILVCLMMISSVAFALEENIKVGKETLNDVEPQNYGGIYYDIIWPTTSTKINSHFGMRWGEMHYGTDVAPVIAKVKGDKISAIAAGKVMEARSIGTYGNVVYLNSEIEKTYIGIEPESYSEDDRRTNSKGIKPMDVTITLLRQSRYAHLDTISVTAGANVNRGANLGTMGTTGGSTGVHLHFEIRDISSLNEQNPSSNAARDPLTYYPNISFQSLGVFDRKGNFYGVEDLLKLTQTEIANLGISKEEINVLITDDYVKEMIFESDIIKLRIISNYLK